jgi:hypothetical protein
MKWKTGEDVREGDVFQGDGPELIVTAVGRLKVLAKRADDENENPYYAPYLALLRRAGETADRDHDRYEYCEASEIQGGVGWQSVCHVTPNITLYRRPRVRETALPCPFCGVVPTPCDSGRVEHINPDCPANCDGWEWPLADWNRRAAPPAADQRIAELERIICAAMMANDETRIVLDRAQIDTLKAREGAGDER